MFTVRCDLHIQFRLIFEFTLLMNEISHTETQHTANSITGNPILRPPSAPPFVVSYYALATSREYSGFSCGATELYSLLGTYFSNFPNFRTTNKKRKHYAYQHTLNMFTIQPYSLHFSTLTVQILHKSASFRVNVWKSGG